MTHPALTERPEKRPQAGVSPARPRPAAVRRRRLRGLATVALFIAPAFVLYGLLVLAPIAIAAYTSLFRWNGLGGWPEDFIGFDNFTRLFDSDVFHGDLRNALIIIVLSLLVQLPFALGLALLLNQRMRGRAVYRLLFFAPYVLSEVITGVLFSLILSPETGLANQLLRAVGLEELERAWLADPSTVIPALFAVMTWKYFGFYMILFLAGRQGIPRELGEAAAIDGATAWEQFRHVTLPLLGPTVRIAAFLSIIGTVQLFDLVWVLTGGGPDHASETLAVTMFQFGFKRTQIGYASAISVVMFLLSMIFALAYLRFVMRRDTQGAVTTMGDHR